MRLRLDATPEELCRKAHQVLGHLADHCEVCDEEVADQLRKALPRPMVQSEHKAMRELQAELRQAYAQAMERVAQQALALFEQDARHGE